MEFRLLRTFRCVADTGSLSRASERLRIAQPALSRQIKQLEHIIGVALFDRHVRGMELTPAGTDLYRLVSGPLYQLEQSFAHVRSSGKIISGQVTLGVLPTVAPALAVRLLERARQDLPEVTVRLRESYSANLLEWIQSGTVDAGFLYGPTSNYHLRTISLLTEEIVLLSPPDALPRGQEAISIHQLASLPLGLLSQSMGPRILMDRMAHDHGVTLRATYEMDSFPILIAMVKRGLCHTFLPVSSIAEEQRLGQVVTRHIQPNPPRRELILALPSQRPATRATEAVITLLRTVLSEMIAASEIDAEPGIDLIIGNAHSA